MTAWAGFFSPLSANIYFPALNILASSLHVSSSDINASKSCRLVAEIDPSTLLIISIVDAHLVHDLSSVCTNVLW